MFASVPLYRPSPKSTSSPIRPGPEVRDHFDSGRYPTCLVEAQQWLAHNIDRDCPAGWTPEDPAFARDGCVYTWREACWIGDSFGDDWRLPTDDDWEALREVLNDLSDFSRIGLNEGHWRSWLGNAHGCRWQGTYWSATSRGNHHASACAFNHHRTFFFKGFQRNAYAVRLVRG